MAEAFLDEKDKKEAEREHKQLMVIHHISRLENLIRGQCRETPCPPEILDRNGIMKAVLNESGIPPDGVYHITNLQERGGPGFGFEVKRKLPYVPGQEYQYPVILEGERVRAAMIGQTCLIAKYLWQTGFAKFVRNVQGEIVCVVGIRLVLDSPTTLFWMTTSYLAYGAIRHRECIFGMFLRGHVNVKGKNHAIRIAKNEHSSNRWRMYDVPTEVRKHIDGQANLHLLHIPSSLWLQRNYHKLPPSLRRHVKEIFFCLRVIRSNSVLPILPLELVLMIAVAISPKSPNCCICCA
jgi:hypothetical protein